MKRLLVNLVLVAFIAWIGYFVIRPMLECWILNGAWSLRARSCDMGTYTIPAHVPVTHDEPVATIETKYKDLLEVTSDIKKPFGAPLVISGKARGPWYFEASFPITIVDWDGRIIGEGHAEATSDWMTTEFVPFKATVPFVLPPDTAYKRGAIILKKDNPSGLPQNEDSFEIPIVFK